MSITLSGDHVVTDTGVSSTPPVRADLALDGQDAWVELSLAEHNLREVLKELLRALAPLGRDRIMATRGTLEVAGPALDRLLADYQLRQALTFRLSQADADDLSAELEHLTDAPQRCEHPIGCHNVCAPGFVRCPVHEDPSAAAS